MTDPSSLERRPPARACERMISLVVEGLSNCRNAELRTEVKILRANLIPAANELDKWVAQYRTYGAQPCHTAAGLAELHNEILQGDLEIGKYLIRTVEEYVSWCADQLSRCNEMRTDSTEALQEGFIREDMRRMTRLCDQLKTMLTTNNQNKKWMYVPKGQAGQPSVAKESRQEHRSSGTPSEISTIDDSNANAVSDAAGTTVTASTMHHGIQRAPDVQTTPVEQPRRTYDQDRSRFKRIKRHRVLPVNPELASHAASSILRAMGRHPDTLSLNSQLRGIVPEKLRKEDIAAGRSLAQVQSSMIEEARRWWAAQE
jgi:hypothetical protein